MSGKRKPGGASSYPPKRSRSQPPLQSHPSSPTTQPQPAPPPKRNTAIYITNLPSDVTTAELDAVFSRYGIIAEDISTGAKRIKIYTVPADEGTTETPKGDALVVYFRAESVQLAVDMMDDTIFRVGKDGDDQRIHVQPADMNYKVEKEPQPIQQRSAKDKREIIKRAQKMNNKLADWDDSDLELIEEQQRKSLPKHMVKKNNKLVILKHVFTLAELDEDVAAALDIKQDIREGCEEIGPVTSVTLYDLEPDGVISVRFKDEEDAAECVRRMNGRFFSGRRLDVARHDGIAKYRKSKKGDGDDDGDTDKNEEERLRKFGEWLESAGAEAEHEGEWHDDDND
ncbi:uncharacterized protein V1518DRAFT_388899 [Limtongia smithiae]|uniref:uncharacterized protein n=1 Tax=Limtongia smithiae TaxID=1125753 RepID=UPI0034CDE0AC